MNRRRDTARMLTSLQARLARAKKDGEEIILVETWELDTLLTGRQDAHEDRDDGTTRMGASMRAHWAHVNQCEQVTEDCEMTQEARE